MAYYKTSFNVGLNQIKRLVLFQLFMIEHQITYELLLAILMN